MKNNKISLTVKILVIVDLPYDDQFWENADHEDDIYEVPPKNTKMDYKEFQKTYSKQVTGLT